MLQAALTKILDCIETKHNQRMEALSASPGSVTKELEQLRSQYEAAQKELDGEQPGFQLRHRLQMPEITFHLAATCLITG